MKFKWSKILEHLDTEPEAVALKEKDEQTRMREVWARLERLGQNIQDIANKEHKKDAHGK